MAQGIGSSPKCRTLSDVKGCDLHLPIAGLTHAAQGRLSNVPESAEGTHGAWLFLTPGRPRSLAFHRFHPNGAAHTSPGCNPGWSMNQMRSEGTPHPGRTDG
jgi:hypothetical protein